VGDPTEIAELLHVLTGPYGFFGSSVPVLFPGSRSSRSSIRCAVIGASSICCVGSGSARKRVPRSRADLAHRGQSGHGGRLGYHDQMLPTPYGFPITLDNAKKAAAPALAEARKNDWLMAVAVVDTAGDLVYFEKMDGTQNGSVTVAIAKARSAALFKRPTKAFQDTLAAGGDGLRVLKLENAVPVEGGVPIVMDGKIVGAIGLSGGSSQQDGQCAEAGANALK
jgi:glc operon protein GlcG